MIFLWYIISNRKAKGLLKPTDFIVKTIVTTELIKKIADKQGVEMRDCYTGFKWIAREIRLSEGKQQYIGGGEESYGFLAEGRPDLLRSGGPARRKPCPHRPFWQP